ncbi:hypothetical protein BWI93_27210, partial [Siphonobacter sp. BAB-5385]|uniref:hypothetical protein n=1 Tax=Siphonobacter sp. BAB-5385 TaxID=1864822 RepID=UPI000BC5B47A
MLGGFLYIYISLQEYGPVPQNIMEDQIEKAADHFIELYAEEIKNNELTEDTLHKWWTQTRDQYEDVDYDDVKAT